MFIVAEISANHSGSLEKALELVKSAAEAGAEGVKFQTFTPEKMAVPYKLKSGPWKGRDLIDLYKEAHTPRSWFPTLFIEARDLGLVPFSTPFSIEDVDFLETLNCSIYKIASFELVDLELVEYTAKTGKPLYISTGQASKDEIGIAYTTARKYTEVTLLHCVSEYPTKLENANILTMAALKQFGCKVGLSDHSKGSIAAIAATVLGAEVIEKHLGQGLDKSFSMAPEDFKQMVTDCRNAEKVLGKVKYGGDLTLRRSLYFNQNLKAGTEIKEGHLKTARPNLGLSPIRINEVLGTILDKDVKKDDSVLI